MDHTSLTFGKSLLSGVWEAGVGMVEGVGELAVSGYQIATDAKARATAWQSTQAIAAEAAIYGDAVIDDPAKLYRDARDGTLAVYDHFEQAKALAEKEGRLAEFYGEMTGKAIFEVGTILIPVGKLARAGKLGKAAEVVDEAADTGKKIETAEDILSPAKKAQKTIEQPLSKERNEPVSAIQRCPVKECDIIDEGKKKTADSDVVPNKLPQSYFDDLAFKATRNLDSDKLVLGRGFEDGKSYTKVAAHYEASYFKMDNWRELSKTHTPDEIWRINESFLDQQLKASKQIILSHDPAKASRFYLREVQYLEDLGYKFVQDGWVWRAVK